MKTHSLSTILFILAVTGGFQSCASVFSELQSARMVGKGRFEMTPLFSTVSGTDENETEHIQNELGIQAILGLTDAIDFRFRSEVLWIDGSDYSDVGVIFGFGPKFRLIENRIALSLPFGTTVDGAFFYNMEFQPTLLLTLPAVPDKLDITISPKYIIPFCDDCQNLGAINLGLAISTDLSKWAIRPEYGRMYDFGEKGYVGQFSIGLSGTFGKGEH